jgi:hypothetical protein
VGWDEVVFLGEIVDRMVCVVVVFSNVEYIEYIESNETQQNQLVVAHPSIDSWSDYITI